MISQRKFGELLVTHGIIDSFQLSSALNHQAEARQSLGESLVELGFITESALLKALSEFFNVPSVNLTLLNVNQALLQRLPLAMAQKYSAIPIGERQVLSQRKLLVAMIDPTNQDQLSALQFHVGMPIIPFVSTISGMRLALRTFYSAQASPLGATVRKATGEILITELMRQKELLSHQEKRAVIGHRQPVALLGRLLYDKKLINRDELLALLDQIPLNREN